MSPHGKIRPSGVSIALMACIFLLSACETAKSVGGVVTGVGGVVFGVVKTPFKIAGALIPDGDVGPAPPSGSDDNPKVGPPYEIAGITYYPHEDPSYDEVGYASWYGEPFHGRRTANGEVYDMNEMTAAHRTLPLPSYVRVTNLSNGRTAILRVNDRGPFANNRILDASRRAAQVLGFEDKGVQRVRVQVVDRDGNRLPGSSNSRAPRGVAVAYYVQVGSFSDRDNAQAVASSLRNVGGRVTIQDAVVNGSRVYRVRVGPFEQQRQARRSLDRVKDHGHRTAQVFSDTGS